MIKFVTGPPTTIGFDLGVFLGSYCSLSETFSVSLDVDIDLRRTQSNLIVVGGPVTNLIMAEVNRSMAISFKEEKQWAIKGTKKSYHEDSNGLIARFPNPYNSKYYVLVVAGIRFSGTKAAVIGLTRMTKLVLSRFTAQKEFYAIIQGFDLDGDGKIDSVELLE
jgi:hypothetical protein